MGLTLLGGLEVTVECLLRQGWTLGTRGGVPDWNTANTLQGNGQSTQPIPTQYIPSSFRIFQANFLAVFPGQ